MRSLSTSYTGTSSLPEVVPQKVVEIEPETRHMMLLLSD